MRLRGWTRALPFIIAVVSQPSIAAPLTVPQHLQQDGGWQAGRPPRNGFQESAFKRGYSDGYQQGLGDGRDGNRYDPVGHEEYRSGDQGYSNSYGSRDAYRNNYRAGFRQGYEDGYRDGTRSGRR
jgi:flagellar biosynthesis/type III secretory pathway protein FliH